MAIRFLIVLLLVFPAAFPSSGAEIAGAKFADAEQQLVLNGLGLRKRAFFHVYAIGLYLPAKKTAAAEAIGAAGAKRVAIQMLRDVDAVQFVDALRDGMKDNLSEAEMKGFDPQIAQLSAMMSSIKLAKEGMRITLDWAPAAGTVLTVNGKAAGSPIAGEDFYRALLRIWLGENPVQSDLKRALLGEKQ